MIIKRINVLKLAIVQAVIGAAIGLLMALFFLVFGSLIFGAAGGAKGLGAGVLGGLFMLIGLPIVYGVGGFIFGALGAFIYNLVAGVVGGVEIEVE